MSVGMNGPFTIILFTGLACAERKGHMENAKKTTRAAYEDDVLAVEDKFSSLLKKATSDKEKEELNEEKQRTLDVKKEEYNRNLEEALAVAQAEVCTPLHHFFIQSPSIASIPLTILLE
jgi:hypothetical protein